jgi:magnesium-transporting ATPase (P-type)
MDRHPRDPGMPILDTELYIRIMLVGSILLIAAFGLYEWELRTTGVQEQARTVAVNVFVMVEAFYLFNSRSFSRSPFALGLWTNPWVIAGFAIMVVLQLAFTYVPFMNILFGSAPIGVLPWIKIIGVSILAFIVIEVEKWLRNRPVKTAESL